MTNEILTQIIKMKNIELIDWNFIYPNLSICYCVNNAQSRTNLYHISRVKNWAKSEGKLNRESHEMEGGNPRDEFWTVDFDAWFEIEFCTDSDEVKEYLNYELKNNQIK